MPDPFPEEVYAFRANVAGIDAAPRLYSDEVYEEYKLNREDCSPMCLFIPRQEIMLKLIRACIGAKSDWDLWFNREPDEPASPTVVADDEPTLDDGENEDRESTISQLPT